MAKDGVKKYPFRMPTYLAWFCAIAGSAFLAMGIDIVQEPPHSSELLHLVPLTPEQNYYFDRIALAFLSWILVVYACQFVSTRRRERFITLDRDAITLPASFTLVKDVTIPYDTITHVKKGWTLNILSPQKWVRTVIKYDGGRTSFLSAYLPDYVTYEDFYATLMKRWGDAKK